MLTGSLKVNHLLVHTVEGKVLHARTGTRVVSQTKTSSPGAGKQLCTIMIVGQRTEVARKWRRRTNMEFQ